MCDTAVALEAVTARIHADTDIGVDLAHRRLMAAQAVVVDRLPPICRYLDVRRIIAEHFMIRVNHARTALLKHVVHGIVVRQVAVRTFQRAMEDIAKVAASLFIAWHEPQNAGDPEKAIAAEPMPQTATPMTKPPARQASVCF